MRPLEVGTAAWFEMEVRPEHTADAIGNPGMHVLSSPAVLALAEGASYRAVKEALEEGEGPAGVEFHFHHRAPAAVGTHVRTHATVQTVDGRRVTCQFRVESAAGRLLADGTVTSVIVNLARQKNRG